MKSPLTSISVALAAVALALAWTPIQAQDDGGTTPGAGHLQEQKCPSASVFGSRMLSSVCWSCLFPIKIAGVSMGSQGNKAPSRAANTGFCYCPGCGYIGRFGVTVGYWSPSRLIEQVKQPGCSPSLGGADLGSLSPYVEKINRGRQGGQVGQEDMGERGSLSHWNYFTYPVLAILGLFDSFDCVDDGASEFDLLHTSLVFPNWTDDSLASYLQPEGAMFGNPIAALAQPIDCVSATTNYGPVDALFWISGCWGSHYPLTGHVSGRTESQIQAASLRTSRALFMLHRIGLTKRQGGNDAVCKAQYEPIMSKSFYRKQQFWPMPESGDRMTNPSGEGTGDSPFSLGSMQPTCCHALGASTLTHGEWRKIPATAEDHVHLVWRWVDCCVGVCI